MNLLLDTHILLWALFFPEKLTEETRTIISDSKNAIYVSAASIWEIQIKHNKRPETMPYDGKTIVELCRVADYKIMDISPKHIEYLSDVISQGIHNDPFDHLLISAAMKEQLTLMTHDDCIARYSGVMLIVS